MPPARILRLPLEDIDPGLVSTGADGVGTPGDAAAVITYIKNIVSLLGGTATVGLERNAIIVGWTPAPGDQNPVERIILLLQEGRRSAGILLLQLLCSDSPDAPAVPYNLGMALGNAGGLDIKSPVRRYRLRSLPGEYSGLHLVCLLYAGMRHLAPGQDIGMDLAREYAAAESLHNQPPSPMDVS